MTITLYRRMILNVEKFHFKVKWKEPLTTSFHRPIQLSTALFHKTYFNLEKILEQFVIISSLFLENMILTNMLLKKKQQQKLFVYFLNRGPINRPS